MKKCTRSMLGLFITAMTVFASAQPSRTVTVTGTVLDSVTGHPVVGARVLLIDSTVLSQDQLIGILTNLGSLKFDTATTDAEGKIAFQMRVSTVSLFMGYSINSPGYQTVFGWTAISPLSATVDLGIVKMTGSTNRDTLTVSGNVVDSLSGEPVGNALVVISGLGGLDTSANNRFFTNTDGSFSRQVIITKLYNTSVVGFTVSQLNYSTKFGQMTATGESLNLGTIRLRRNNSAVLSGLRESIANGRSDGMSIFSLNGKMLYDGPVVSIEKLSQRGTGAVMVAMKRNRVVVESRKVFLER